MLLLTGYYCDALGMTTERAQCSSGYYCPEGQTTAAPVAYECPAGSYCPQGSPQSIICERGIVFYIILAENREIKNL